MQRVDLESSVLKGKKKSQDVPVRLYIPCGHADETALHSTQVGIILTHGAGGGIDSKYMQTILAGLVGLGLPCIAFECRGPSLEHRTKVYQVGTTEQRVLCYGVSGIWDLTQLWDPRFPHPMHCLSQMKPWQGLASAYHLLGVPKGVPYCHDPPCCSDGAGCSSYLEGNLPYQALDSVRPFHGRRLQCTNVCSSYPLASLLDGLIALSLRPG